MKRKENHLLILLWREDSPNFQVLRQEHVAGDRQTRYQVVWKDGTPLRLVHKDWQNLNEEQLAHIIKEHLMGTWHRNHCCKLPEAVR